LFVLVLRFLPRRFVDSAPVIVRPVRLAMSVLVGAAVFVFAIVSTASRADVEEPSVSAEILADIGDGEDGKNVIDVILVDVRGFDTLGEITVLSVAAIGVVSLASTARARRRAARRADPEDLEAVGR
jgi:multicomponent Na+:H+ antiporter subunit A